MITPALALNRPVGHFAHAEGAPCPTLVLDGATLPPGGAPLLGRLAGIRAELSAAGAGHVLKNALIRPSAHPLFDLDYHFVQSLPGGFDQFDLRGSCGHSILAAVDAAARTGMIPPLAAGHRIRVNVLNNGDNVVCEVTETAVGRTGFTAHFLCNPARPLTDLLMTGEPVTQVMLGRLTVPVSLVSMGNPYVFVAAAGLGVQSREELFGDNPGLFELLGRVRLAVCEQLGWDPSGAFPKVAALLPQPSGAMAVRAISVPSWHPTLALTGATCLGTAMGIEGTVPWSLLRSTGHGGGMVRIDTPGGEVRVVARTAGTAEKPKLAWVSVGGKQVSYHGRAELSADHFTPADDLTPKEPAWLPLPA
ncbi:PrpF domain-containing protein [Kitasatospora sp. NBC_00315]|uniref:PrpF domain-containing protein n=1 Tax=Kitasatospora sp. NBC_00315 TaxID=2975963 RepID=UPI00324DE0DB